MRTAIGESFVNLKAVRFVNHSKFLGYTKDKDGNLVIIPEEADLVRRIFRLFLEGNSSYKIKRILEADGILTVYRTAVLHRG